MPNGRLTHCVIAGRKSADLYQNTSGNAASVTLYANAISTNTNSEMTVVVGIASTTLAQKSTMISASAGTFCSMSAPNYYTECFVGSASTYIGFTLPPTGQYNQADSTCSPGVAGANHLQIASYPEYEDTYGCRINENPDATSSDKLGWLCMCSNTCIQGKLYGGNEIQNPAIWMREYPTFCHTCCGGDYLWNNKFIGVQYNNCCACCWTIWSQCGGTAGTWHAITARHVGMGNSANARQNALQRMINWCCQCGCLGGSSSNSGMSPITVFSGCAASQGCRCRWGTHCNLQMCKMCACHCCAGGGFKMWNWYALDRDFQCCCDNFQTNDYACFKRKDAPALDPGSKCFPSIDTGKMRTPLWYTFMWCCNQPCGCAIMGSIRTNYNFCQDVCGEICWQHWQNTQISSCCNGANWLCQWACCFCHPCQNHFMRTGNQTYQSRMSPYGFAFGMTNCAMMIWAGYGDDSAGGACCHRYIISYPDLCYMRCCQNDDPCYFYQRYRLDIHAPLQGAQFCYEFPVKYLAWNCFVTNKHDGAGCNYVMIRSQTATHCGIFSFDADDMRKSQGPFCGCEGAGLCCGTICVNRCFQPDYAEAGGKDANGAKLTKVADFPTDMTSVQYANVNDCVMCTTCLFRADFCTWTMSLWNYCCQRWDGFQTSDLVNWSKISDPYNQKMSNVLTTFVSSDYACIVDDCNCYFANIDCSGIIDYKLSVNQYERTGIVLSNNDRLMVNNDADVCLNFQVWGYEG